MQTKTFDTTDTKNVNDFKTSIETATSIATYSGAALNGAAIATLGPSHGLGYYPAVTASSQASAYTNASTVVFTGYYQGQLVTRTATIGSANGGSTYIADGPMEGIPTQIVVAAQAATNGAFTFGWDGLAPPSITKPTSILHTDKITLKPFKRIVAQATGNVVVGYSDGTSDTIAMALGLAIDSDVRRIYSSTAVKITLYY